MPTMKRILITSAGGAPATNFVRSLHNAPEPFWIIGVDANKYTLQRAETNEKYLIPKVNDPSYFDVLFNIVRETGAEFLHCQMSYEMLTISELREKLHIRTNLPNHHTIDICENKYASFERWKAAALPVPETMLIENVADLNTAFDRFGPKIWIREIRGSAGKGALPTDDLDTARRWIDLYHGWGNFTAAQCLESQTITWQSIWHEGELIVAQGRKRLYWEFANRAPSGVTGITGTGVTVSDPYVDDLAQKAILAIDNQPNGIFGVDLTYDKKGVPNLTEINIGRFFTTHYFFTAAGLNMPYIYVKLGYGEAPPLPQRRINPLTPGMAWVRGMDCEPTLVSMSEIDSYGLALRQRQACIREKGRPQ
jgi:hypothetical protein